MTFEEWLASKNKAGDVVSERLAELFAINGGALVVTGWGSQFFDGSPYGRTGLDQGEALELIYLHGVVEGFAISEGKDIASEVFNRVIIERIKAKYEAAKKEEEEEGAVPA